MSDILTEHYCTECEQSSRATPTYCPDCGAEASWDERPAFQFDEDALPVVFSHEVYQDQFELWRAFCRRYFGDSELIEDQIAGLPDEFPSMKYCVFDVWFKLRSSYELAGPFLSEEDARKA